MKKKKDRLMVAHGDKTHPAGEPCKLCYKIQKEFDQDMKLLKDFKEELKSRIKKLPIHARIMSMVLEEIDR